MTAGGWRWAVGLAFVAAVGTAAADELGLELARGRVALREENAAAALKHSREGLLRAPNDAEIWRLHLQACELAGTLDLCLAAAQDANPVAETVRRAVLIENGLLPASALAGPGGDPAEVTLHLAWEAIAAGSAPVALALLADRQDPPALSLRVMALEAAGREKEAAKVASALLLAEPGRIERLAWLLEGPAPKGPLARPRAELLALAAGQASSGLDPVGVYAALEVALRVGDATLAERARARLVHLGEPAPLPHAAWPLPARKAMVQDLKRARDPVLPPGLPGAQADVALRLSVVLQELGRIDEALRVIQQARTAHDDVALAIAESLMLLRRGRTADALKAAESAALLAARPGVGDLALHGEASREQLAEAHYLRGVSLSRLDRTPEALVAARTAAQLAPNPARLVLVGGLHESLGEPHAAFAAYAAAYSLGEPGLDTTLARLWVGTTGWPEAASAAADAWLGREPLQRATPAAIPARPAPGRPAPDVRAALAEASPELAAAAPKVIVVAFWASWCGPCATELPLLAAEARGLAAEGVSTAFLAVSVDRDRRAMERFAQSLDLNGLVITWKPAWSAAWRVDALPTTFVVDGEGILRSTHTGYAPAEIVQIGEEVRRLAAP